MNRRLMIIIAASLAIAIIFFISAGRKGFLFPDKAGRIFNSAKKAAGQQDLNAAIEQYQSLIEQYPKSGWVGKTWIGLAEAYRQKEQLLEAEDAYKNALSKNLGSKYIKDVKNQLQDLNMEILFSPIKTNGSFLYKVEPGDTLISIASRFNTTVNLIRKANDIKGNLIRPGMELKISKAKFSVMVDKSQSTLALKSGEEILKVYTVSTGKNNSTPTGTFQITTKLVDPVWYTAGAVVPADSPDNILGTRWLGISKEGYGIHGTTEPETIGQQITRGCVRMHNNEVEELFDILPSGAEVVIME